MFKKLKGYKEGFITNIENKDFIKGLNKFIIKIIAKKKKEPNFLIRFRLNSYLKWKNLLKPTWSTLKLPFFNFQKITYFSKPKKNLKYDNFEIVNAFKNLGISLDNTEAFKDLALDAIFDSVSIATTFKEKLSKLGIIFCSIKEAIKNYPELIKKYLSAVVSSNDNYFTALNSAVFTDGSFCFIPQNTNCPLDLSTYFRINNESAGQFERTLIITEKNSIVTYFEGCSAPVYTNRQLHAAVVELISFSNSQINYATIQNWYGGNKQGVGGIYNFVTKRGLCLGNFSKIHWTQIETGSAITWKYPSCILLGKNSLGEFFSLALTKNYQQADTGTKMIHFGEQTKSKIISKGISFDNSLNTYRGLVKIASSAFLSRNFSQCDSYLIGANSTASAYPYFDIKNNMTLVEHEASISKINSEQLFYFFQRGISEEQALSLLITGFCKDILNKLPLEFISEAKKLLAINFQKSII